MKFTEERLEASFVELLDNEGYLNQHGDTIARNLDDVLISILITIAPRWIIMHNTADMVDTESVLMIKEVFKDRFKVCRGCERCCRPG